MTTERSSFGLNSIIPTSYRTKAEAFAKCLQDKLKSLGGGNQDAIGDSGILLKYTDEEICDSVFLQGSLAYKRPSIPNSDSVSNGLSKKKYVGGVVDRRGFSSDSEDESEEDVSLPTIDSICGKNPQNRVIASSSSIESNSSWCSCEGEPDDFSEGQLASQVKGSPPIRSSRKFIKKRLKGDKTGKKIETEEQDLFFDFDTLSPADIESDDDDFPDGGRNAKLETGTPPPSPTLKNYGSSQQVEEQISEDKNYEFPEAEEKEKTDILTISVDACEEVTEDAALEELSKKIEAATCFDEKRKLEESEDDCSPRMKLRRCSSLKSWKTPPGTPGSKKIVRFADSLGLDLADVRMFLDEVPRVPSSAYSDLKVDIVPAAEVISEPTLRTLIPMFQQPGIQLDFIDRVTRENVCLERAVLTDTVLLSITGLIRVRNLSYNKSVHIRYSKDNWTSFSDLQATYVPSSSDGFTDQFSFTLYGHTLNIGDRIEFAIKFDCPSGTFWDSNGGVNYVFQCMPQHKIFTPLDTLETHDPFY